MNNKSIRQVIIGVLVAIGILASMLFAGGAPSDFAHGVPTATPR